MPLKLRLGLGILPTPPPPPPRRTTLVCDLLNAVALNGDEITLLVKSNRATATNTDISCDISLMTQNEQNSNTKKKCTHANHIDFTILVTTHQL